MYGNSCWRARPYSPATTYFFHTNLLNFCKIQTVIKSHFLMPGASNFAVLMFSTCLCHFTKSRSRDCLAAKGPFYKNKLSNCPFSLTDASHKLKFHMSVCLLTMKISQWTREVFCSYRNFFFFVFTTITIEILVCCFANFHCQ